MERHSAFIFVCCVGLAFFINSCVSQSQRISQIRRPNVFRGSREQIIRRGNPRIRTVNTIIQSRRTQRPSNILGLSRTRPTGRTSSRQSVVSRRVAQPSSRQTRVQFRSRRLSRPGRQRSGAVLSSLPRRFRSNRGLRSGLILVPSRNRRVRTRNGGRTLRILRPGSVGQPRSASRLTRRRGQVNIRDRLAAINRRRPVPSERLNAAIIQQKPREPSPDVIHIDELLAILENVTKDLNISGGPGSTHAKQATGNAVSYSNKPQQQEFKIRKNKLSKTVAPPLSIQNIAAPSNTIGNKKHSANNIRGPIPKAVDQFAMFMPAAAAVSGLTVNDPLAMAGNSNNDFTKKLLDVLTATPALGDKMTGSYHGHPQSILNNNILKGILGNGGSTGNRQAMNSQQNIQLVRLLQDTQKTLREDAQEILEKAEKKKRKKKQNELRVL